VSSSSSEFIELWMQIDRCVYCRRDKKMEVFLRCQCIGELKSGQHSFGSASKVKVDGYP
jgi:hypothetical protein